MTKPSSAAVFCASSVPSDEAFIESARQLGTLLAHSGITMVYGGGTRGLMGQAAAACHKAGGRVTGVLPEVFDRPEVRKGELFTELHIVGSMHERKAKMYELADAFIILPGGIGTLDEFFEIYTWKQIGFHTKNIILLNIKDFFTPLLDWLDGLIEKGFLSREVRESLIVCSSCTQVLAALEQEEKKLPDKVSE